MNEKEFAERICEKVAREAWLAIVRTTASNVVFSWGLRGVGAGVCRNRDGFYLPCLVLQVSALIHTGRVAVGLNQGADVYEIALFNNDGEIVGEWRKDIYFDQLGATIDEMIERPKGLTDDEYQRLALMDSDLKDILGI